MEKYKNYRCFKLPENIVKNEPNTLLINPHEIDRDLVHLHYDVADQLAQLIPVLLCGEQSAVGVFHHEVDRLSKGAKINSSKLFTEIEQDEMDHEEALQKLVSLLPQAKDKADNLRRSRRFYLDLSRSQTVAQHFSRISQLDRAVCQVMDTISKSVIARQPRLKTLFNAIKKDEAKHSYLCKLHALNIGADKKMIAEERAWIVPRLIGLLLPYADAFERLKVDPDRLFAKLRQNTQ